MLKELLKFSYRLWVYTLKSTIPEHCFPPAANDHEDIHYIHDINNVPNMFLKIARKMSTKPVLAASLVSKSGTQCKW